MIVLQHRYSILIHSLIFTFGLPREFVLVGEDGGGDGGAVVAAPSDHHEAHLGHPPLRAERHWRAARGSLKTHQKECD